MHTTGRVDHRSDWKPKRSLNYMKRQNDMDRIAKENQSLLRRLQTVRPQYDSKEWEVDYRQHQTRSKNLQLFPHIEVSTLITRGRQYTSLVIDLNLIG